MKFLCFLIVSANLFSQDIKNSTVLNIYSEKIQCAESNFFKKQYDSAFYYYNQAFSQMRKFNPSITGFKSDVNNFSQLKTFLSRESYDEIINYNSKTIQNSRLEFIIDSLFLIDQSIRNYRVVNQNNDSLNKKITRVDYQNFTFLYKTLDKNFPTEYEISDHAYSSLNTLFLHAAYVQELKSQIKVILEKNLHNGKINPKLFVSIFSLISGQSLGWDIGLTKFSFYNNKNNSTTKDNKTYMIILTKKEITKIDLERRKYFLSPVSHIMKCCCYLLNNPKSNMLFHVPINEYSISDEIMYKYFMKKVSVYNCK